MTRHTRQELKHAVFARVMNAPPNVGTRNLSGFFPRVIATPPVSERSRGGYRNARERRHGGTSDCAAESTEPVYPLASVETLSLIVEGGKKAEESGKQTTREENPFRTCDVPFRREHSNRRARYRWRE